MAMAVSNEQTLAAINDIYQAFGTGDVEGFAKHIDDECEWDFTFPADHAIPWLQGGKGKEQAQRFMLSAGQHLDVRNFEINHIATAPNLVVVIFSIDCIVRSTGLWIHEREEPHIWHFNDEGRVIRFRHAADTHLQRVALGLAE
jgi:ketosteroid isomerase-like protein